MLSHSVLSRSGRRPPPSRRPVCPTRAGRPSPPPTPTAAWRLLRNRGLHSAHRVVGAASCVLTGARPLSNSAFPPFFFFFFFSLRSTKIRSSEKFHTRRRARFVSAPALVPPAGPQAPGAVGTGRPFLPARMRAAAALPPGVGGGSGYWILHSFFQESLPMQ